jgi:hypothetical protein
MCAPVRPFAFELTRVDAFPGAVWLAPEPVAPFLDLIAAARSAYPGLPPYGDPAHVPVPHCTIATVDARDADGIVRELRRELAPHLPVRCHATELTLLAEDSDGMWHVHATFPFEGPA